MCFHFFFTSEKQQRDDDVEMQHQISKDAVSRHCPSARQRLQSWTSTALPPWGLKAAILEESLCPGIAAVYLVHYKISYTIIFNAHYPIVIKITLNFRRRRPQKARCFGRPEKQLSQQWQIPLMNQRDFQLHVQPTSSDMSTDTGQAFVPRNPLTSTLR